MNLPGTVQAVRLTASALVKTGPGVLYGYVIVDQGGAVTAAFYDNTAASGTVLISYKSATNVTNQFNPAVGIPFSNGLYVDISGTTPSVTVLIA
jgi:hypothetical protein